MKKYILKRWKENTIACIVLCLNVLMTILSSFVLMEIIDILVNRNINNVVYLLFIQVILGVLTGIMYYAGNVLMGKAQRKMENDIRHDISTILVGKSYQQYDEHEVGEYLSWYSNDVAQINLTGVNAFFALVISAFQMVSSVISLLIIHWVISFISIVTMVILFLISRHYEEKITDKANDVSIACEKFYSNMKNILSGFGVMKSFNVLNEFVNQVDTYSDNRSKKTYAYTEIQVRSNAWITFGSALSQVLIIGISIFFILRGEIQVGAIIGIGNFLPKVLEGLNDTFCYKNSIISTKPYIEKIERERNKKQDKSLLEELLEPKKCICLDELSYSYGEKKIFDKINLELQIGGKYALIGSSGGGKTTLMKIILGQLRNYQGKVLFDTMDAAEYSTSAIMERVAYIEQQVYLFNTTIRENITLWQEYTEEELEEALKSSALYEDMKKFPQGLDTFVGENGKNLSGGQRQRIGIARAIISGKKILCVDEGTSALDQENADVVEKCLLQNRTLTLLLISHHLSEQRKKQFDGIIDLDILKMGNSIYIK